MLVHHARRMVLVVGLAVAALAAGVFVGSADEVAAQVNCGAVADSWSAATSVTVTDDFVEFEWDDKEPKRVDIREEECGNAGLDAFLKQTRDQTVAIHTQDCQELRSTYERALKSQQSTLQEAPTDAPDERLAPPRPTDERRESNIVAIPNPRSQYIKDAELGHDGPGAFAPILFDLDQAREVLDNDCR